MFKLFFIAISGALLMLSATANATVIDFESGTNGVAVGSDYASDGVVFTNAYYASSPYASENGSSVWVSGESDSSYNGVGNVSITGYFTGATDYVGAEIEWADFASTTSTLQVFDAGGNLVGSVSNTSASTPYPLSIAASGIASFVFSWTGGGSGDGFDDVVGIDNFSFGTNKVPEPASLALLGIGLIGLAGIRRRNT